MKGTCEICGANDTSLIIVLTDEQDDIENEFTDSEIFLQEVVGVTGICQDCYPKYSKGNMERRKRID